VVVVVDIICFVGIYLIGTLLLLLFDTIIRILLCVVKLVGIIIVVVGCVGWCELVVFPIV